MSRLYLYDDAQARSFEPFALTRPASTLVVGMTSTWERWRALLRAEAEGVIVAPHLADFDEPDAPYAHTDSVPAGAIVANARCVPALVAEHEEANARAVWRVDGRVAAVRLARETDGRELVAGTQELDALVPPGARTADVDGWWLDEVWDVVRLLPAVLADDLTRLASDDPDIEWETPRQATIFGDHPVRVATGAGRLRPAAVIEPHVVFDAAPGPIRVGPGAHVRAYTRLTGPCYVGPGSTVMGGDVSATSIGPMCKVRGEVSNTVFIGYANKGHDGFVGHSVLGRWVNLGASTVTSNLKNTYGAVALWTPSGVRDTGLQFLGTLFGDHAKTGIGLRLTTGTVLGAGANVYGSAMPPKVVPPFSWGDGTPYRTYRLEKFLEVAERMMSRRHVQLTDRAQRQLSASYAARWSAELEGARES